MRFNEQYFTTWLEQVRQKLLSLSIAGNKTRLYLFHEPLTLDEKSWKTYFDDGYLPWQAVNEDLELPWIENKPHRIL